MTWSPGGEPPPREADAMRRRVLNGAGDSQAAVVEERQTEILAARPVVERVSLRAPRDPDLDRQRRGLDHPWRGAVVWNLQSRNAPLDVSANTGEPGRGQLAVSPGDEVWVIGDGAAGDDSPARPC